MNKHLIERFKNGEIAINLETQDEWNEFMQWLEENTDLKWINSNNEPTELKFWKDYEKDICVTSKISYSSAYYYREEGYEIVKYKDLKEKKGMKTSEFIKRVEELGYEVAKQTTRYVIEKPVSEELLHYVADVDLRYRNTIRTNAVEDEGLFDLIVEYAKTPLEDREEPKRYVWKLEGVGSDFNSSRHYFNYIEDKNSWSLKDKNNGFMNRTIFTEKEFTQLKSKLGIELEFEKEEIK